MGIDVGVVRISYLDRPRQPIYNFLWWLAEHAGHDEWGGGWCDNAFLETDQTRLISKAELYARQQSMSQDQLGQLLSWVRELPWDGNVIMLHLNW